MNHQASVNYSTPATTEDDPTCTIVVGGGTLFDRDRELSISKILHYFGETRAKVIHKHPSFQKWLLPTRFDSQSERKDYLMVVKSQMVKLLRKITFSPKVKQVFRFQIYFEEMGKTSLKFSTYLFENDEVVAKGICITVCVEDNKTKRTRLPAPYPLFFKSELPFGKYYEEGSHIVSNLPNAFKSFQSNPVFADDIAIKLQHQKEFENAFKSQMQYNSNVFLVQYSDEDGYLHTTHTTYVRYVEDYLKILHLPKIDALFIEFLAETHVHDILQVNIISADPELGIFIHINLLGDLKSGLSTKPKNVCKLWCGMGPSNTASVALLHLINSKM